ncbi:MAG: hypothetical protein FWF24_05240 [Alphaproteobacteria bacterium]|nr:hypothetical protein [Alphaproteobacteria bacterium]
MPVNYDLLDKLPMRAVLREFRAAANHFVLRQSRPDGNWKKQWSRDALVMKKVVVCLENIKDRATEINKTDALTCVHDSHKILGRIEELRKKYVAASNGLKDHFNDYFNDYLGRTIQCYGDLALKIYKPSQEKQKPTPQITPRRDFMKILGERLLGARTKSETLKLARTIDKMTQKQLSSINPVHLETACWNNVTVFGKLHDFDLSKSEKPIYANLAGNVASLLQELRDLDHFGYEEKTKAMAAIIWAEYKKTPLGAACKNFLTGERQPVRYNPKRTLRAQPQPTGVQ